MKTVNLFVFAMVISVSAFAQDLSNYPISLVPLETINTSDNDYAPCLSPGRDLLYFSSTRSGGAGSADCYVSSKSVIAPQSSTTRTESRSASGDYDIRTKGAVSWLNPKAMSEFNTSENEGALSLSADGKTVVFAAEREDSYGDADLYIGDFADGVISHAKNLGAMVNSSAWDSQPSLSSDGRTLYFASKRSGGVGKTDIWMSVKAADGSWSAAQCLDRSINTDRDERSPFITSDGGTLVFASSGHAGFGGFDLFYSSRETSSSTPDWSAPTNLGGIINSDNDELFYTSAAVGEYFYVSSSRNKDRGLDIYQGTPNLIGMGTVRYYVSVIDSLTTKGLPSTITIYDVSAGIPVATVMTTGDQKEELVSLPANREYRIEANVQGYPTRTISVQPSQANTTQRVRIMYGTIGFDFSNYQIPFFVTGYYRPNTSKNLEKLFDLRKSELSDASYVERFERNSEQHQRYIGYAKVVDELFGHVVSTAVDTVFPRFRKNANVNEILEITVYGYADPKPIIGRYVESESIPFVDANGAAQSVEKNDKLTNLSLSGLRAFHSSRLLQEGIEELSATRGFDDYKELVKQGRVRFRCVGGGVNTSGTDFAAQRRIKIDFARIAGGAKKSEFDTNAIKK